MKNDFFCLLIRISKQFKAKFGGKKYKNSVVLKNLSKVILKD